MKRALSIAVLAALSAPLAQAQPKPAEQTILPGYWEYKASAVLGLVNDKEFWCVKPDEIDKFFTGPCNRHHTCVYPVRVVGNGKARFEGYWQNKEGKRATVKASGEYAQKRFKLKTEPTIGTNGVPLPAVTLDAKWLGDTCKPGAKTPK